MVDLQNCTVAEAVSDNIKMADVFKENGIDFCCGGAISIKKACADKKIDFETVKSELNQMNHTKSKTNDYNSWDLGFLADFILNTHHKYVSEESVVLLQYSNKVAKVHATHYPQVIEINNITEALVAELTSHMQKEEMILFPFIKDLATAKKTGINVELPHFGTIKNPINIMDSEHDAAGDMIKKLAQLTNDFTPPEGACNTFKALYAKLEEFQNDLFQHIHLENNILFPKAILLEEDIVSQM